MRFLILSLFIVAFASFCEAKTDSPRVIVLTDGETDDRCSMVHFLLHANDMKVEALIQTNSCFQTKGWSHDRWLHRMIDAYSCVYPNLKIHDPEYPDPKYLRRRVFVGDENPEHIKIFWKEAKFQYPGQKPMIDPSSWEDTPGSERIVEVLLEDDTQPVFILCWGGANTAARAFHKIKTVYPEDYERAISKAVMYCIWYQDDAGPYIEKYHPGVTILLNHHFSGSWDYGTMTNTADFVSRYMRQDSNPLGRLYTQPYISEGDTPSFLYAVNNGLRSYEDPTYGGWGGKFYKVEGFDNIYRDTGYGHLREWIEPIMHDYQTRLQWCVSPRYRDANHHPIIETDTKDITVHSGEIVTLSATISDPDYIDVEALWLSKGDLLSQSGVTKEMVVSSPEKYSDSWNCGWVQYPTGTYKNYVDLTSDSENEASVCFVAPKVESPETIHIILEATDNGTPRLTSYKRFIVTVVP